MTTATPQTVGRESELERLDALLDELRGSAAACLAVEGEPGIGKTHLLAELGRRGDDLGMIVLKGTAAEFERDVPFGVWADALDAYVASRGSAELDEAVRAELGGVLPSLPERPAPLPADERYRTHRAARTLLETLAGEQSLVLVLDDLHWADGASLELLAALLKRSPSAPVLFAAGFRSGQVPPRFQATLAEPIVETIRLRPLRDADARELLGEAADPGRFDAVFEESGGNPFYVLQLGRSAELPSPSPSGDSIAGETGVPSLVVAALLEEIGDLSRDARRLVEAASVAGDPFAPELALAIAELDVDAGYEALDELLDGALVRATDVPRQFAFRHPLVRRAVYESTKGGWRMAAHSRAADALAASGAAAAVRAHHVEQSAAAGDPAAIAVLIEAATASAGSAPASAARWFEAALRLVPDTDDGTRLGLLIGQAQALRATGDREGCRSVLLGALDTLPADDLALRIRLTAACAFCEDALGWHSRARARLDQALAEVPESCPAERAEVLLNLAGGAFFSGELERMRETAKAAAAISEPLGDDALVLVAAGMLGHAEALLGCIGEASEALDRAVALTEVLSDAELAARIDAINRLGWAEFYLERFEQGIGHLERGIGISRATGQGQFIPYMQQGLALCRMALGRRAEAVEASEAAIESARTMEVDYVLGAALVTRGGIALSAGDLGTVKRVATEALELFHELDPGLVSTIAAGGLAAAEIEAGELDGDLEAHIAAAGGEEMPRLAATFRVQFNEVQTRGWIAAGDLDRGERCASLAEAAAEQLGLPVASAQAGRARAAMLLACGEAEAAAEIAIGSAEAAAGAGARIESARSSLLVGTALAEAGNRKDAIARLREAEGELDACGALRPRDEARRKLRRLGARHEPRGPAAAGDTGLESLSEREREVAGLVTDRLTNKEIAAQLFLSEKTIESHLRNIFFKLGASSRVEVARIVES